MVTGQNRRGKWSSALCTSALTADRPSSLGKGGYGRRFTTLHSMVVSQATAATTPKPSLDRKQAVGRNIKFKWKRNDPTVTLLRLGILSDGDARRAGEFFPAIPFGNTFLSNYGLL